MWSYPSASGNDWCLILSSNICNESMKVMKQFWSLVPTLSIFTHSQVKVPQRLKTKKSREVSRKIWWSIMPFEWWLKLQLFPLFSHNIIMFPDVLVSKIPMTTSTRFSSNRVHLHLQASIRVKRTYKLAALSEKLRDNGNRCYHYKMRKRIRRKLQQVQSWKSWQEPSGLKHPSGWFARKSESNFKLI